MKRSHLKEPKSPLSSHPTPSLTQRDPLTNDKGILCQMVDLEKVSARYNLPLMQRLLDPDVVLPQAGRVMPARDIRPPSVPETLPSF